MHKSQHENLNKLNVFKLWNVRVFFQIYYFIIFTIMPVNEYVNFTFQINFFNNTFFIWKWSIRYGRSIFLNYFPFICFKLGMPSQFSQTKTLNMFWSQCLVSKLLLGRLFKNVSVLNLTLIITGLHLSIL